MYNHYGDKVAVKVLMNLTQFQVVFWSVIQLF